MNIDRQQVLLKEYEICQQDNSSIGNQIWLSASVLMSANVALLAWFAYVIIKELPLRENTECLVLGLVTAVGMAIIAIFYCWIRWLNRMQFLKFINYERMRDIETALGMWKNRRAYGLDNREERTCQEEELMKMRRKDVHHAPSKGLEGSKPMAIITMVLWGILVVAVWVPKLIPIVAAWVLKLIPICLN